MGVPSIGSHAPEFPKLLVHISLLLAALHHALSRAFLFLGLADLLDDDYFPLTPSSSSSLPRRCRPDPPLPVLTFAEAAAAGAHISGGRCTVCLRDFAPKDEVRRLGNCRHCFHRRCIDGWIRIGRSTCPLCRKMLAAGVVGEARGEEM